MSMGLNLVGRGTYLRLARWAGIAGLCGLGLGFGLAPAASASTAGSQRRPLPAGLAAAAHTLWLGHAGARPRIVGGTGATQGQLGFMAFIVNYDSSGNPQFACSGTLVASNLVLTAGHCATDETSTAPLPASSYRVVTGATDWTDSLNRHVSTVSQVIVNPRFNPTGPTHDAALLVLSAPVSDTPIKLWSSGVLPAGTGSLIAGWGLTDGSNTGIETSVLQSAPTVIQSVGYCSQPIYANYVFDPISELCTLNAPTYDTGTCEGDSGGPLLVHNSSGETLEAGLTSVGEAKCNTSVPDFFTSALWLAPWVTAQASALAPASASGTGSSGSGSAASGSSASGSGSTGSPGSTSTPQLPTLAITTARGYARQTLTHALAHQFADRRGLKLTCVKLTSARANCGFSFRSSRSYYAGAVIVAYYLTSTGRTAWAGTYTLHWVNYRCYFHTSHPASCTVHRRSGSSS